MSYASLTECLFLLPQQRAPHLVSPLVHLPTHSGTDPPSRFSFTDLNLPDLYASFQSLCRNMRERVASQCKSDETQGQKNVHVIFQYAIHIFLSPHGHRDLSGIFLDCSGCWTIVWNEYWQHPTAHSNPSSTVSTTLPESQRWARTTNSEHWWAEMAN